MRNENQNTEKQKWNRIPTETEKDLLNNFETTITLMHTAIESGENMLADTQCTYIFRVYETRVLVSDKLET